MKTKNVFALFLVFMLIHILSKKNIEGLEEGEVEVEEEEGGFVGFVKGIGEGIRNLFLYRYWKPDADTEKCRHLMDVCNSNQKCKKEKDYMMHRSNFWDTINNNEELNNLENMDEKIESWFLLNNSLDNLSNEYPTKEDLEGLTEDDEKISIRNLRTIFNNLSPEYNALKDIGYDPNKRYAREDPYYFETDEEFCSTISELKSKDVLKTLNESGDLMDSSGNILTKDEYIHGNDLLIVNLLLFIFFKILMSKYSFNFLKC